MSFCPKKFITVKLICLTILLCGLFSFFPLTQIYAQSVSNCVVTKIGNPSASPILPPSCSASLSDGDASACMYVFRGDKRQVGNPALSSLVADISKKVGVPASLLLGIMRIETATAFLSTDATYFANDYDANTSHSGAVGIMQFMPETFRGVFFNNKSELQRLFNKTSYLIEPHQKTIPPPNDAVFRRASIKDSITAAAFFTKELKNAKSGSQGPWDEVSVKEVAKRYHGACPYPGGGSYCDDLWESVSSCNPKTYQPVYGPFPVPQDNIGQEIASRFNVHMKGFSNEQLQWTWELFAQTANTKFAELVKGTAVVRTEGGSQQVACGSQTSVLLHNYTSKELFQFILTHELGHVIRNCNPRNIAQYDGHLNAFTLPGGEGGISYYARNAQSCTGSNNVSEDYADMIAYYLHPKSTMSSCGPRAETNPYAGGNFGKHFSVARAILER